MTAADFDQLSDIDQDRAAQQALQVVLDSTPRTSPHWMALAHAMAVLAGRLCQGERAAAGIAGVGCGRRS